MIKVKTPGKLYVAGEYAIVDPGNSAILVAINQFITIQIKDAGGNEGVIHSEQYPHQDLRWFHQNNGEIQTMVSKHPFSFVLQAMKVTEQYIQAEGKLPLSYDLMIQSDLDNDNGKKYGLGSSAAVTVASVKAVCAFYHFPITKLELFKLAAIAHLTIQGNGSLGDVAASAYGGWLAYSSFDRQWLKKRLNEHSLVDVVNMKWPKLKIEPLDPPAHLKLLVGWTGSTASTSQMINQLNTRHLNSTSQYQEFLNASQHCVNQMIEAFKNQDLSTIQQQIVVNRQLLNNLGKLAHINIETQCLNQLCQIALDHNAVGKSSGAGGGDCGIVIINDQYDIHRITQDWVNQQILPLPFKVYQSRSLV